MRKAIYFNKENEDLVAALDQAGKMEVFSDYVCGLIRMDLMRDDVMDHSINHHLEDIKSQLRAIKQRVDDAVSITSKPLGETELLSLKSNAIPIEDPEVKELVKEIKEIESTPSKEDAKKSLIFV